MSSSQVVSHTLLSKNISGVRFINITDKCQGPGLACRSDPQHCSSLHSSSESILSPTPTAVHQPYNFQFLKKP